MSKKYKLDLNEANYLHCVNGAFAGLSLAIDLIENKKRNITKKRLIALLKAALAETGQAICSEYIRGELIRKNIIENDPTLVCLFDPSDDNKELETEVFTQDDLLALRTNKTTQNS